MAYTLFIFLPVAICIAWLVIHSMLASRTETFPEMAILCIACGVYLFADACHATQPKGSLLDTGSLIASLFAGPCIIPMIILYLQKLMHHKRRGIISVIWIIVPSVLFTGGLLLNILNFEERIGIAFNYIVGPVFHSILAIELVVLTIFIIKVLRYSKVLPGNLFSFLFKNKPISLARLQIDTILIPLSVMILRILISDNLYTVQSWAAIVSAGLIASSLFIFALNALFGVHTNVTWKDFRYINRFNYNSESKHIAIDSLLEELIEEADDDTLKRIHEKLRDEYINNEWQPGQYENISQMAGEKIAIDTDSWDENSLLVRFQHLMVEKKMFLSPKLTLDEVANELDSNKTYVSKMVNNAYHLGFPELINTMRIDYAEQYILSHRDAKQSEIAKNSGFLSASSFNTIFKKVTGVTPKVWLASVDNK